MSALARYFHAQGYVVAGYDKTPSPLTDKLAEEGIPISFVDEVSEVQQDYIRYKKGTMVVYTPAVPKDNVLLSYFTENEYHLSKRAEVLGIITRQTINLSVAGTHGKTTTCSIVATILLASDRQFSAFLGGISTNLGSNYFYQKGSTEEHLSITEADEFDRSFLHLSPDYSIITSTDADHLDIYGEQKQIEESYIHFSELIKDMNCRFYAKGKANNVYGVSYSATDKQADYYAIITAQNGAGTHFSIANNVGDPTLKDLYLNIPGLHNLENAVGATLMTLKAGISLVSVREGLASFKGIKRRFEYILHNERITYIDDYAHHPSELKAIISSVKDLYPHKKITAVFQPHLFSRTRDFMQEFARELSVVDELIILPIYPAREQPMPGISSETLLSKVTLKGSICIPKDELLRHLAQREVEVLLTLGAGDIDRLVSPIKSFYSE